MSQLEDVKIRPEFESVDLTIDVKSADRHINEVIQGLHASKTREGNMYRTMDGTIVAIVGSSRGSGDDAPATLAYRTEPSVAQATRKAKKILTALESYAARP